MGGQRKGEWSIKVTGNWRIVFCMDVPGAERSGLNRVAFGGLP